MTMLRIALAALSATALVNAYTLPTNFKNFYNTYKTKNCTNVLFDGFDDGTFEYCSTPTTVSGRNAIYLHSTAGGGRWNNMDVDCDGANNSTGACSVDQSGQGETAFKSSLAKYGITDLDAQVHPYIVFGNDGNDDGHCGNACSSFDPTTKSMNELSVMAVVCNNQVHYGIWGDINGYQDTGEASLAMTKLCFPSETLDGNHGHDAYDVLYIGFTGTSAFPGSKANWKARTAAEFEASIKTIGDTLVASIKV